MTLSNCAVLLISTWDNYSILPQIRQRLESGRMKGYEYTRQQDEKKYSRPGQFAHAALNNQHKEIP